MTMRIAIIALLCPLFLSPAALADDERAALKTKATELAKRMASKDAEDRLSAVRESGPVYHRAIVAPLIKLLKDKDTRVRTEAITSLGLRDDPKNKKSAARALAGRLKPLEGNEKTREELKKIVQALHDLAQPTTIKALLDMKADADPGVARARSMAVGNIPSKEAIERLIGHGDKGRKRKRGASSGITQALAYATQEKVKGGIEGWRKWWKENKATFDVDAAAEARANKRAKAKEKSEKRKDRKGKGKGKRKKKDDA